MRICWPQSDVYAWSNEGEDSHLKETVPIQKHEVRLKLEVLSRWNDSY